MGGEAAAAGGVFKFLSPRLRPQSTDIQAAVCWGVAATTTALWLIQVLSQALLFTSFHNINTSLVAFTFNLCDPSSPFFFLVALLLKYDLHILLKIDK
jgi:hypothetical protein